MRCTCAPAPQSAVVEEEGAKKNDEAFKKVIEDSHLDKLAQWPGLPLALAASAIGDVATPEPWPLAPLVGSHMVVDVHGALHAGVGGAEAAAASGWTGTVALSMAAPVFINFVVDDDNGGVQ